MAETLARHGHTVFATMRDPAGRNATNAVEIRELAKKESLALHVLEMDVTDDVSVEQAVRTAVEQAVRIDVAINNAGYGISGLMEATTTEQAQQIMNTNFFGCVRVNRAVLPYMRRHRSGLLLHISSGAGRLVIPGFGFYCATKFAMEALGEAYHYELAGQGIESSIVEPGAYQTAVFENFVIAADKARTDTYGAANQIADKVAAALNSGAGNAQELADAVLRIVETPAGKRELRYRVSVTSIGVDEINALCANVQARMLEAFGLSADTKFVQRSAAGTA
jgi:NAD(P)-dependent dehydrogenase (short-subunit alcohol dehydrogenase family)